MRVNGRVATLGESADPVLDWIECDGRRVEPEPLVYWIVHKPRGVLSTRSDPDGRATVIDLVPERRRVFPVGRLDLDSEGLVLLTNDGALTQALLHPSLGNEREYRVTVRGRPSADARSRFERGIPLEDGRTAPARIERSRYDARADCTTLVAILHEGRKRQIRRCWSALGHPVVRLLRTRMGPLRLGRLEPGEARRLRSDERRAVLSHARRLRQGAASRSRRTGRKRQP